MNIAKTQFGSVQGLERSDEGVNWVSYRGVPYAEPPIHALRWKKPVDPAPWDGIRPATEYAPAAWSLGCDVEPFVSDFYYMGYPRMSEDCLYLNIDTPASPGDGQPVYVWFHGGGLSSGYSYEIEFDPREMVRRGIVVVTVGQRLGLFGYLALPSLADGDGLAGNYGFWDQIKAMEFIRDNIASFGGDPDNVTIGGQSGGSQKCCLLAASPLAKGLFRRMILHSGLKYRQPISSMEDGFAAGETYLREMGIDPDAAPDDLRAIPAETFLGQREIYGRFAPGRMVCDGVSMPWRDMRDAVLAGMMDGLDILSGTTLGEATKKDFYTAQGAMAEFKATLGQDYPAFKALVSLSDGDAFLRYRELTSLGFVPNGQVAFSRNLTLDRLFAAMMKQRDPLHRRYTFYFTHLLPNLPDEIGGVRDSAKLLAWHTSDLWFSFASIRAGRSTRPWRESDFALARVMCDYWCNFISRGDPNGANLPVWPEGAARLGYMTLDDRLTAVSGLDELDKLAVRFVSREYGIASAGV